MTTPNIHIMPLKRLLSLTAVPADAVAVISSSYPVQPGKIPIPHTAACYQDRDDESAQSFSPEQAGQFAAFVKNSNAKEIYVCCDAGQSRSPAIAAALRRYFGQDELAIWRDPAYHPNALCYRRMCQALGICVTDQEMDRRIYISRTAFRAAIQTARAKR